MMTTQVDRTATNWLSVLLAGAAATVVVTLTMLATGTNILAALGGMILGPGADVGKQYLMGGVMHLAVGSVYAILFALLFARVRAWAHWLKGIVFGFVITVFALVFMPLAAGMMGGHGAAANPCAMANPCSMTAHNPCAKANPCSVRSGNPCAMRSMQKMSNPCAAANPCAMKNPCAMSNPCSMKNPCSGSAHNPCAMANPCSMPAAHNPCAGGNPCNPGGGGNAYGGLISLLNHIAFGLTLALIIGARENKRDQDA